MPTTVLQRRPTVAIAMGWLYHALSAATGLDPRSQQLLARVARVSWKIINIMRETDQDQPVDDQIELGYALSCFRHVTVRYGRFWPGAAGRNTMSLTQRGSDALTILEQYDPITQGAASFDTDDMLRRVFQETRFGFGA